MDALQIFAVIFICVLVAVCIYMMVMNKKNTPSTGGGCGTIKSIYVFVALLIGLALLSFLKLI